MFKKYSGEKIPSVIDYVKKYITEKDNIDVMIATDSQNGRFRTYFCTIIALYDRGEDGHGHGAHCIYNKWSVPVYSKSRRQERLLKEVEESITLAKELRDGGIVVKCIDIDINPKEEAKSSDVFQAAFGWVTGEGFECRYKTLCPLATTAADHVVKRM